MTKIVAICGIDGAGKSTLSAMLRRDPDFSEAKFIEKRQRANLDRVIQSRIDEDYDDNERAAMLFEGPYARAVRWAQALDFLDHYNEDVEPALEREKLIVSDRWSYCRVAFANVGTYLGPDIHYLLEKIPHPDLTIFLETKPSTAYTRIIQRGEISIDERLNFLEAYHLAYKQIFARFSNVVTIRGQSVEQSYHEARMAIWRHIKM